ncbi:hypothetical protein NDU88_003082, partial [Pleurodeles waltl]
APVTLSLAGSFVGQSTPLLHSSHKSGGTIISNKVFRSSQRHFASFTNLS